jgi:hypothetical protein
MPSDFSFAADNTPSDQSDSVCNGQGRHHFTVRSPSETSPKSASRSPPAGNARLAAIVDLSFAVARGPIANVELGIEVKILANAIIKQIGRVQTDLVSQVAEFIIR